MKAEDYFFNPNGLDSGLLKQFFALEKTSEFPLQYIIYWRLQRGQGNEIGKADLFI